MTKLQDNYYKKVIHLYYTEGWSEEKVSRELAIGHTTVNRWTNAYAKEKHKEKADLRREMGVNSSNEKNDENLKNIELRRLKRKLERSRRQVASLEKIIQVLSESAIGSTKQ